jgi:hypothetical protein
MHLCMPFVWLLLCWQSMKCSCSLIIDANAWLAAFCTITGGVTLWLCGCSHCLHDTCVHGCIHLDCHWAWYNPITLWEDNKIDPSRQPNDHKSWVRPAGCFSCSWTSGTHMMSMLPWRWIPGCYSRYDFFTTFSSSHWSFGVCFYHHVQSFGMSNQTFCFV